MPHPSASAGPIGLAAANNAGKVVLLAVSGAVFVGLKLSKYHSGSFDREACPLLGYSKI